MLKSKYIVFFTMLFQLSVSESAEPGKSKFKRLAEQMAAGTEASVSKVAEIEKQSNEAIANLAEFSEQMKRLEKNVGNYLQIRPEAENRILDVVSEVNELSKLKMRLAENRHEYEDLLIKVNKLKEENGALERELAEKKSLLERGEGDRNSLLERVIALEAELQERKESIQQFTQKLQVANEMLSDQKNRLETAESQIQALQNKLGLKKDKIKGLKGEREQLQGKNTELEQSLQQTKEQLDEKARGLEGVSLELRQKQIENQVMQRAQAQLDLQLKRDAAEKARLEREMTQIKTQLQSQQGNSEQLQQALKEHQGQILDLNSQMSALQTEKQSLDEAYAASSAGLQKLRWKYELLKGEKDKYLQKIEFLEDALGGKNAQLNLLSGGKHTITSLKGLEDQEKLLHEQYEEINRLRKMNEFYNQSFDLLENIVKETTIGIHSSISFDQFNKIKASLNQGLADIEKLRSAAESKRMGPGTSSEDDSTP